LVLLAVSTGLRQSELFGLKWEDIDLVQGTMNVTRSIVYGVVGPCKTESSQKPVSVHPLLSEALSGWRKQCAFTKPDDWVFASKRYRGRRPYWGQSILRRYVRPVGQRVGIQKCIGWHTSPYVFNAAEKRGYGIQGDARAVAPFISAVHVGCLHSSDHPSQICSSSSHHVIGVFVRSEWYLAIVGIKCGCCLRAIDRAKRDTQKGTKTCPLGPRWF
jgi:hypothetical protein